MRFPTVSASLVLAAGLGFGLLSLGCGQGSPTAPMTPTTTLQPEGKPSGGGTSASFEKSYMQSTIDREELIRQLALLAVGKQNLHPDLVTFSQTLAGDAGHNVSLLQGWLSLWYGMTHVAVLSGSSQRLLADLGALEGADFETAYMNKMISLDQVTVREGQRCYARASHTSLIEFGFELQYARTQQIAQLRSWLCSWFAAC
jgi:uncharacterized protein (DUF305 family)